MNGLSDILVKIAKRYSRFAAIEAGQTSPIYKELCLHIAQSNSLLRFIARLPVDKQQPNLFLAAVRKVAGVPKSTGELDEVIEIHGSRVREVMLTQTTQTNEPARCAVLLPALAMLPQPLALLEVGASAGLCLIPDKYGYDYGVEKIDPSMQGPIAAPFFSCEANDDAPLPRKNVDVIWRAGLDLKPLDVLNDEDSEWLQMLVWPDHYDRAAHLAAALDVARSDPPPITKGDLLRDLEALVETAPESATLVIFHTAVLGYVVNPSDRNKFVGTVKNTNAVWISNEVPSVFPEIAENVPDPASPDMFLLAIDGKAVAWTSPHGQLLHWFG